MHDKNKTVKYKRFLRKNFILENMGRSIKWIKEERLKLM